MRTTLDIESDILQAAKEIAARERSTAGAIISRLARRGLQPPPSAKRKLRNGIPVFAASGQVITTDHIRRIADEESV